MTYPTEGRRGVLVDLDGVMFLGNTPIEHACDAVNRLSSEGIEVCFVTNNASKTPEDIAAKLQGFGVADTSRIVNSSRGAAHYLADQLPSGSKVLGVGGPGVNAALVEQGFTPVTSADDQPAAVLQGYGPDVAWPMLAEAAIAIQGGAHWVATNTDRTLPTERGETPGNGALVAAVRCAVNVDPVVVGKPSPKLYELATRLFSPDARDNPLVIGDRLDTDIRGANNAGFDSVLVLTGVSTADDASRDDTATPTWLCQDLRGLFTA